MNVLPPKYRAILGVFVVTFVASVPSARSCGDFRKPETHFDGVNEFGFVSYWDQIGEIKLADGSVLPLIIGFRSDWETLSPSPHLGSGWLLALLDANFVQRSENAFDMISIDGYTVPFGRDPNNPSILNGAQGWKAEVKGDVVTVWAECGWKLQFTKGKISAVTTPKGSTAQIRRDQNGLVSNVIEGTNVLLKVATDSKGIISGLSLTNNENIGISLVEKPIIQSVNGINVVGFKAHSVGEITRPDGSKKTFDYSPTSKLQPAITISTSGVQRSLVWDPVTRHILCDGPWHYDIVSSKSIGQNAAIKRTSENGMTESWHYSQSSGEEVAHSENGRTTKKWHTTGKLSGKIRSVTFDSGKALRFSYDSNGALLRIVRSENKESEFGLPEETLKIVRMEDLGELSPNSPSARIVRNNISFDVYNRDDPEFDKHLSACISAINKDSRAMLPKHGDINQIQIARTASGKLYLRILNKAGQLLFSSVNQRVYWPIKKNSST